MTVDSVMTMRGSSVRAICIGLAVLLLGAVAVGCDKDRTDAVRLYNDAMRAFEGGGTGEAVGLLEESLEKDPTFYQAAFTLGQLQHRQLRNPEDAAPNFRRALDQEPENPRFNYHYAMALADSGDHEDAVDYFEVAISHDSDDARFWFGLAMSQEATGEFTDAVDSYMSSIELQPRLRVAEHDMGGEHYYRLGELYYRFRLFNEAVQVFENGAENNPTSARLQHGLGLSTIALGRHDDAVEAFEKALELDPSYAAASFSLVEAYRESGDIDKAIEQIEALDGVRGLERIQQQAAQRVLNELRAERDEEEAEE